MAACAARQITFLPKMLCSALCVITVYIILTGFAAVLLVRMKVFGYKEQKQPGLMTAGHTVTSNTGQRC